MAMERRFYACYLLSSISSPKYTYIGFTVNPARRIRQHNGEITSGAFRTKKRRPWQMVLCVYGFATQRSALKFEWAWQHPQKSKYLRKARRKEQLKGVTGDTSGNIRIAYALLSARKWRRQKLTVHYFSTKFLSQKKGGLPLPEQMELEVGSMDQLPSCASSFEDEDPEQTPGEPNDSGTSSSDEDESEGSSSEDSDIETPEHEPAKQVRTRKAKRPREAGLNPKKSRKPQRRGRGKRQESKKAKGSPGEEYAGEQARRIPSPENSGAPAEVDEGFMELQSSPPPFTMNQGVIRTEAELVSGSLLQTPELRKEAAQVQVQSPFLICSSSPKPSLFPSVSFLSPCPRFPAISMEHGLGKAAEPLSIIFISSTPAREIIEITDSPL